jgi:hypothetical protein
MPVAAFDYWSAYAINLGILSQQEQERLLKSRVSILGMTAGGVIAIMLARTGVSSFTLIDHSRYQASDINRDFGCYSDNIGSMKVEVIRGIILSINPQAIVEVRTDRVGFDSVGPFIEGCDVFFAQSDDLALSVYCLILAQQMKKLAVTVMPSGMTAYVEVFPPGLSKIFDPAELFGAPVGMSYRELSSFLRSPLNRCGRRWHITEGKWSVGWFKKWRDGKELEAQLCPSLWLGASLAAMETLKYIIGRWQKVRVPAMWHISTADNRVRVERYRRRSYYFEKFIYWTFGIGWLGIGKKYHRYTARRLVSELDSMEKQEKAGKQVKVPLMWHLI